ncbi:MAG: hypothetical protein L3J83_04220, partial [Proteobacteria bacterium]|nr:hypothetical protein [Pseudomonadota bacterium]
NYLNGWIKTRNKMMAFKLSNCIQKKRSTHLSPTIRKEKAMEYHEENYPRLKGQGKTNQSLTKEKLMQIKLKTNFTKIHELHVEISENNEKLVENNASQVAKNILVVIKKLKNINKNSIYTMPWVVFGKARLIQGRYKDAEDNLYNRVINDKKTTNIPLDAYTLLAETYIRDKQMDKAQNIIKQGSEQFGGDDSPFQIHKAMMSCLSKNEEEYKKIIEICSKNPEPSINTRCLELESNIEIGVFQNLEDPSWQWWQGCALEVPFTTVSLSNVERKNKLIAYEKQLRARNQKK